MVGHFHFFDLIHRVIREHQLQRAQHRHRPRRAAIEIFPHAVLEQADVDDVLFLRHADARAEVANRFRGEAAAAQPGHGRHPRIVPAVDVLLLDQLQQLALAHHRVVQVETRELVLTRTAFARVTARQGGVFDHPVVERPMVDVLQRAQRMRDAFDGIRQRVREVVHRIDAPRRSGAMVLGMADPVQHRIAHGDVRRPHVDLRAQHVRAVGELAVAHAAEELQVLAGRARAIWRVLPRLGERAAMLANLVRRERVDIRHARANQRFRVLIELFVVIGRVVLAIVPVKAQPLDVVLDRIDVLDVFLDRIGVVEAEVAVAAEFVGDAKVETDRLGVPDVQVAVRFRREARDDAAVVLPGGHISGNDLANKVLRRVSP